MHECLERAAGFGLSDPSAAIIRVYYIALDTDRAGSEFGRERADVTINRLRAFASLKSEAAGGPVKPTQAQQAAEVKKAATDFEALLVDQMLKEMWKTVPQNGMLDGGNETGIYRDMFSENLAQHIAQNSSIGVRDVLIKDINRMQKK